ncbi:hypothetical protein D3C71_1939100 [compost metagenome]
MRRAAVGDFAKDAFLIRALQPGEIEPIDAVARSRSLARERRSATRKRRPGDQGGKEQR